MSQSTTDTTSKSTAQPAGAFRLSVEHVDGFEFRVRFDDSSWPELQTDEPPPLGQNLGPNPARMLAASIGNCLAASLLFCMKKGGVQVSGLTAEVDVQLVRNERKRLRVGKLRVLLHPHVADAGVDIGSCIAGFEDFCVVTQSVREGIDVEVDVQPLVDDAYGCEG